LSNKPSNRFKPLSLSRNHSLSTFYSSRTTTPTMPRIAISAAALFVLAALPNLVSATNYPRASGTPSLYVSLNLSRQLSSLTHIPSSCFVCPETDMAGFPFSNPSDNGNILFCSYPAVPGDDPNDFFCTYNVSFLYPFPPYFLRLIIISHSHRETVR
jgi:hypothetical protein